MQLISTPGGGEVAVMDACEVLVVEGALSLYVLKHPDSNIAVRALGEVARANEAREVRVEGGVERASA